MNKDIFFVKWMLVLNLVITGVVSLFFAKYHPIILLAYLLLLLQGSVIAVSLENEDKIKKLGNLANNLAIIFDILFICGVFTNNPIVILLSSSELVNLILAYSAKLFITEVKE